MLAAVALVPLLAVAAVPAIAQEGRQWIGMGGPEGASLIYGTPESDDIVVAFACERASQEIVVSFTFEPVGASDGVQLDMELSSEAGSVVLNASGHRLLLDDSFVLEATVAPDELREILTEGETLTVMVQDGAEELPLAGATDEVAALFEACG
jgi:hypothetical protein